MTMPSCREVATAVSSGELEEAGLLRRTHVRLHLWMCRHCRDYVRQVAALGRAARQRVAPGDPERLREIEDELRQRCRRSSKLPPVQPGPPGASG